MSSRLWILSVSFCIWAILEEICLMLASLSATRALRLSTFFCTRERDPRALSLLVRVLASCSSSMAISFSSLAFWLSCFLVFWAKDGPVQARASSNDRAVFRRSLILLQGSGRPWSGPGCGTPWRDRSLPGRRAPWNSASVLRNFPCRRTAWRA